MGLHKPEDIMASYPTANNNIESFHSHFKHTLPRQHLPLYQAVSMTYHFVKNIETHAQAIKDGTRKQNRKRGSQHERSRLPIDLSRDEWVERAPENAKALKKKCVGVART